MTSSPVPKNARVLVTGGAGFIGSGFVRRAVRKGWKVAVADKLTYAGDLARLAAVRGRIRFQKTDLSRPDAVRALFKKIRPDMVVHFAAETHVDRSILDPKPFFAANVTATRHLIACALAASVRRFVHISTDEVYGPVRSGRAAETTALHPRNAYAATKAAADRLVLSAAATRGLPAVIVRPCNTYGPWQYPEKLIPVVICKTLRGERAPVYGKGNQVREWLHLDDCISGILLICQKGRTGEIYNLTASQQVRNIVLVRRLLKELGVPAGRIQFVRDRPGHDIRYAMAAGKIRRLGWRPQVSQATGLARTVRWYISHQSWLDTKRQFLENYWKKVYIPIE